LLHISSRVYTKGLLLYPVCSLQASKSGNAGKLQAAAVRHTVSALICLATSNAYVFTVTITANAKAGYTLTRLSMDILLMDTFINFVATMMTFSSVWEELLGNMWYIFCIYLCSCRGRNSYSLSSSQKKTTDDGTPVYEGECKHYSGNRGSTQLATCKQNPQALAIMRKTDLVTLSTNNGHLNSHKVTVFGTVNSPSLSNNLTSTTRASVHLQTTNQNKL